MNKKPSATSEVDSIVNHKERKMDEKQYKKLMDTLMEIRNLLILNASKSGATSPEISKILNTSDSRVRQILTATGGKKKKKEVSNPEEGGVK
jgi:DNA-directed RNA polymerase sigma subunit (sigma70/sigma32)